MWYNDLTQRKENSSLKKSEEFSFRNYFYNMSIKTKLIVYCLLVIFVYFIIVGILYNVLFSNAMENSANETTQVAIDQANLGVENQIKNIENVITLLSADTKIQEFCQTSSKDYNSQEMSLTRISISNLLSTFNETFSEIKGIAIISNQDYFLSNEMYKRANEPITNEPWYTQCVSSPEQMHLLVKPASRNLAYYDPVSVDSILCVAKAIRNEHGDTIGLLIVDTDLDMIENTLENITLAKEGFVYLIDKEEVIIYSPVNHIVPRIRMDWFSENSGTFNKTILGEKFQFVYETSQIYDWRVVGVFSLNATLMEVVNARYYFMIVLVVASIIAFLTVSMFMTTIVQPITKLKGLMNRAQKGELSLHFPVKYKDEIGQLGLAFNEMLERIQHLITMVYSEQKQKRQAELSALQMQIKPHFLYNTFDTIHWMAKKYGADDIIHVIHCLTNLFRIGLSKGNETIMVFEEVEHVKNYLAIQKIRYEDILDYEIEVDSDVERLYIHKLVLQPIVENAIYHGIKGRRHKGRINIKVFRDADLLILKIIDDGVGINKDKLKKIKESLEDGNSSQVGYGMFNVNERIRLSCGKDYGLNIDSVDNKGTVVTIKYPVMKYNID